MAFNSISYWLSIEDGDELEVHIEGVGSIKTSGAGLPSGTWTHIAGTWNGSTLTLFINGVPVASTPTTTPLMADSTVQVDIGAVEAISSGARYAFFHGLIDEAYIFDRALDETEIGVLTSG